MNLKDLSKRADQLITKAQTAANSERPSRYGAYIESEIFSDFRISGLAFLRSLFGEDSPHYKDFDSHVRSPQAHCIRRGLGVLTAAKEELDGGWLTTTRGLISAEIFSDFLEMAEHLIGESYKDPAAVVAGSVLEEHLRQLAQKHGIPTTVPKSGRDVPVKADKLNADLAKAGAYNVLDQKNVTTQLDLRNKAAHGIYNDYSQEQVTLMIQSIRDFMLRVPV